MRRTLFFSLALSAIFSAVHVASPAQKTKQGRDGPQSRPAAISPSPAAAPSVPSTSADGSHGNTAGQITVREVDDAGLRKLLQRDPTQARPLLVNFWATWCEPCREEFPDLVQIRGQYNAAHLDFITVSLDDVSELTKNVPMFLRETRAEHIPAYLLNVAEPEAALNAVDKEWRGELPATFLFDARGQLVFKHSGRIKPDELKTAIEKVLSAGY